MKYLLSIFTCFFLLNAFSQVGGSQNILGTWYVQLTNFPKWTKPEISNPTFNYSLKNATKLSDEVKYQKNGKEKSIKGVDKVLNEDFSKFRWRGRGLLFFVRSKWEVVYMSEDKQTMIIQFQKSLFSPAGIDVLSREKNLSQDRIKELASVLDKLGLNSELSAPVIE